MFDGITQRLGAAFDRLRGKGKLTEDNIREALREVRQALLEADVNTKVVRDLIAKVAEEAVGEEVLTAVSPHDLVVKIFHDALTELMGEGDSTLPTASGKRPAVVLMAGLQGSGKTTTCGKLAAYLQRRGRRPLLVAADLQRPAAIEQLRQIGAQLQVPVHSRADGTPPDVCYEGIEIARQDGHDIVILDTAGRLHIDEPLMDELTLIARQTAPDQILLVCDSMTGQDAVTSAKEFDRRLEVDGLILTKLDGDTRGGAALSVKAVTGRPIKFIGVGEKLEDLEEFVPNRLVGRILGMGDIVGLVQKAQEHIDQEEAVRMQKRILKATFTFEDFLEQMDKIEKMGNIKSLLEMVPGMSRMLPPDLELSSEDFKSTRAIIHSMTHNERNDPDLIRGRRKARIASGSGCTVAEVNDLLKQFEVMRREMKRIGKNARDAGNPLVTPMTAAERAAERVKDSQEKKSRRARRKAARRSRKH